MERARSIQLFRHHIRHTVIVLKNRHVTTPLKIEVLENQSIELNQTLPEISQFLDDLQNYIRELFEEKKPNRHEHYTMLIAGLDNLYTILQRFSGQETLKWRLNVFREFFMPRYDHMPRGQEILFTLADYIERV